MLSSGSAQLAELSLSRQSRSLGQLYEGALVRALRQLETVVGGQGELLDAHHEVLDALSLEY